ncbi:MAG TPA: Rrf2 family transcriptional regulator [Clostridiales bacterium]|nr:Rrf2 family transcriptional regulator [Clostridiales bacterium]
MKISTKGRYALRVIIDISQQGSDKFIPLKEISERQNISLKYLEMIVAVLTKAGYLISLRGKEGGYKLAKEPRNYTVGAILKLTEGSLAPVACLESDINQCPKADDCLTLPLWRKLAALVDNYLESVTIEDLIKQQDGLIGNNYNI